MKGHSKSQHKASAQAQFSRWAKPLVAAALAEAGQARDADADPHKLRVALRRLRTLLWAWRPLVERDLAEHERAFLKWAAGVAGEARDWDIALMLLDDGSDKRLSDQKQTEMHDDLQAASTAAHASSREALDAADLSAALPDMLHRMNRALNTSPSRVPLDEFALARVKAARRTLKKRMRRAARAKRGDYAAWHAVRKAAKTLRYLLEFFAPVLPRRDARGMKSLKKIHERFGALNDAVASLALLERRAGVFADADVKRAAFIRLKKIRKARRRQAAKLLA